MSDDLYSYSRRPKEYLDVRIFENPPWDISWFYSSIAYISRSDDQVLKRLVLARETSIPTYYSSLLLLISAVLFGFIARLKQLLNSPYKYHWILLSVIFLLMSVDETASLHEQLNKPMRLMFNPSGILLFTWVIVAIPLFLLFVIAYLRFFSISPGKQRPCSP
jgi:hypothetical protein